MKGVKSVSIVSDLQRKVLTTWSIVFVFFIFIFFIFFIGIRDGVFLDLVSTYIIGCGVLFRIHLFFFGNRLHLILV